MSTNLDRKKIENVQKKKDTRENTLQECNIFLPD